MEARRRLRARAMVCLLWPALALWLPACATKPDDPALLEDMAELQIRLRLLQSELTDLRDALAERGEAETATAETMEERIGSLQARLDTLPAEMAALCPEPPRSATVTTQCEPANVQRVVVSGDKLVVGDVERVWLEPPGLSLVARMDAGTSPSALHAENVVELERDGSKWVRFELAANGESVSVERPIVRFARSPHDSSSGRRPVVELRVQVGDVREQVELALVDLGDAEHRMVLGRKFLTNVALVEVGKRFVQPAFRAAEN